MSNILISVVIPCYNEIDYISKCLDSLLNQTLSLDEYELIIVDGMSTDGTREIIKSLLPKYRNLYLLDNLKRITSAACNLGIKNSRGDYIAICGSHTIYNSDYLENSLSLFNHHPSVDCVGGPVTSQGINVFSKSAALALSSIFGIGNAKHRFKSSEGFGIISQYPCCKKGVFSRVGFYNEELRMNEDDEFFFRMKQGGIKSFMSPRIKSLYFVRSTPRKLFRQYFNYGYWRWKVFKDYKVTFALRQLIPSFFILSIVVLFILGLILNNLFISFALLAIYFMIIISAGFRKSFDNGIQLGVLFPFAVLILHFSYGMGFIKAFFDGVFKTDQKK